MKSERISLFRVLPANLPEDYQVNAIFTFSSGGPDPGARPLSGTEYSLGTDSDWTPDIHDLVVQCRLGDIAPLSALFDTGGIAEQNAELLVALEWISADSGWRKLGVPVAVRAEQCESEGAYVELSLSLANGEVRGVGKFSVEVFLGESGPVWNHGLGIAREPGFRFGTLCTAISLVIDGDSSLFPILEEPGDARESLWAFRECWIDPEVDNFSSEYVSLVLNTGHPHYGQLYDKRSGGSAQTPLMRQVLASWVALFVSEVNKKLEGTFSGIVSGNIVACEGSIAETAAGFVNHGDLDTSSAAALIASSQRWLDRQLNVSESTQ